MGRLPLRSVRARIVALAVLLLAGAASVPFVTPPHRPEAMRPDNAAGDSACLSCHQQLATFATTAHRLTSRLPTRQSILGSFRRGENVLATANPSLRFRMDSTAAGYYQTAVMGSGPDTSSGAERIAIVTGLRKGQSYLYWTAEHALYQLPISYWAGVGWAYSPGIQTVNSPSGARFCPVAWSATRLGSSPCPTPASAIATVARA